MRTAALLLAAAPIAFARVNSADLNKDQALEALTKIGSLKSMDMEVNSQITRRHRRHHQIAELTDSAAHHVHTPSFDHRTSCAMSASVRLIASGHAR